MGDRALQAVAGVRHAPPDPGHRWAYGALALLLGVPTLLGGASMASMGTLMGLLALAGGEGSGVAMLVPGLAGLAGLAGWTWLSIVFLFRGRAGLRRVSAMAWYGLAAGCAAAVWFAQRLPGPAGDSPEMPGLGMLMFGIMLFYGPLLLPLALYLVFLRLTADRVTGPGTQND